MNKFEVENFSLYCELLSEYNKTKSKKKKEKIRTKLEALKSGFRPVSFKI